MASTNLKVVCFRRFCLLFILMTFCVSLRGRVLVAIRTSTCFGAVCYADDITLLAPSPSALRLMLNICSSFATSHNLIFNADKLNLFGSLVLLKPFQPCSFFLNSRHLQLTNSVKHLGHILHSSPSDDEDIVCVHKDLTRKANYMLHSFLC